LHPLWRKNAAKVRLAYHGLTAGVAGVGHHLEFLDRLDVRWESGPAED
jgi:hypothetical protein